MMEIILSNILIIYDYGQSSLFFDIAFVVEKQAALKKIGLKIKEIREEKGISQAELARSCDIEPQNLYRIEIGKSNVTVNTLLVIAKQLSVTVNSLIEF